MKTHPAYRSLLIAPLVVAPMLPLFAADRDPINRIKLEEPKNERLNRFSIGYAAAWNINADFTHLGGVGSGGNRGPGPYNSRNPEKNRGVDRFYDDGYVRSDISGNKDGLTWFWGYKNAGQVSGGDGEGGGSIAYHSASVAPLKSRDVSNDPQHGMQLTWNRELGRASNGKWGWGLEVGFGWNAIDLKDNRTVRGGTRNITDTYDLGGVDPGGNIIRDGQTQPDPIPTDTGTLYPGTYDGPGPLLDDLPNRTVAYNRNGAVVGGSRSFEGNLWFMHVGPYVEIPLAEKLSAVVSGGIAFGFMHGEFAYREQVSITTPGGGTTTARSRGSNDDTEGLVGGYVSATLVYAIDPHWSVYAGGQFQSLGEYSGSANGRRVEIDLSTSPSVVAGISYSF
jgi:hypothetical protein